MKLNNIHFNRALWSLITGMLLLYGCGDKEEDLQAPRLFMPVLQKDLSSIDNKIVVNLGDMKSAASYTIEVSRDTFKTDPVMTVKVDTNYVVLENDFLWNTIYQVRAQAHVPENATMADSKVSLLGNVRTQKYPSILNVPPDYYATDNRALVTWVNAGEPVTKIKVFAPTDERLQNPLMEFEVTEEDRGDLRFIVTGLDPLTPYQIAAYSETTEGEKLRGYENYTTKVALPDGIDLSGLPGTSLMDTLPDISNGDIIILERGVVYPTDGYNMNKSVTIMGGYGFMPENAVIEFGEHKGFDVENAATIDSLVFKDISLRGPYTGSYLFYMKNGGTIGEIKYEGCEIGPLRGGMRIHAGDGHLDKFTINNCIVDSLESYSFFQINGPDWSVDDILIQNSTFSNVGSRFFYMKSSDDVNSITIESCTFMSTTHTGRSIFDWAVDGPNVTGGIKIYNSIWGPGWNPDGEEDVSIKGYSRLAATNFDVINNWVTSDFAFSGSEIPGFVSNTYKKTAQDLWVAPQKGDFNIEDSGFSAKNSAGDPRWRPGL